jgi:hypothetical protein
MCKGRGNESTRAGPGEKKQPAGGEENRWPSTRSEERENDL